MSDNIPDTPEQLRAAYEYMLEHGVPLDETTLAYETAQVRQIFGREGDEFATVISLGILGAGDQANLAAGRLSLERDLAPLALLCRPFPRWE